MDEKYKGPLAYLLGWLGGVIVLAAFKDNTKLTKFHACQAITISVLNMVCGLVLGFIPYVKYFAWIFSILFVVCMVLGIAKSYKEEECELPVISNLTRSIFKKKLAEGDDEVIKNSDDNDNNQ